MEVCVLSSINCEGRGDSLADSYRPGLSPYSNRVGSSSQRTAKPKVIIADLQEQSLRGICLCFLRNSKKTVITGQNIVNVGVSMMIHSISSLSSRFQEVFFYTFESHTEPLLQSLSRSIADVYLPFLQASETSWGKLNGSENNQSVKVEFISRLNNFVSTLNSAQESINERILLKPCDKVDLTQLQNAADYASVASNNESLASIEETMKIWIRQMEQVSEKHSTNDNGLLSFTLIRFWPRANKSVAKQITLVHGQNSITGRNE